MTKDKINLKIIIPIFLMAIISVVTIYSAMSYTSPTLGNLTLKQFIWYLVGCVLVFILIKLKNEYLYRHTWFLYIFGNLLLLGLLFFAEPVNNSRCWYIIPGVGSIQPSEFMKIFIMLTLATMIHNFRNDYDSPTVREEFIFILKTLGIVLIPSVLTFLEPDTGSVIIYFIIYISMMFASGIRIGWFIMAISVVWVILGTTLFLYFREEDLFIKIDCLIGGLVQGYNLKMLWRQLVRRGCSDMALIRRLYIFPSQQRTLYLPYLLLILG